jgi:tartrate dehydratase alpha subunit/fumarate hydratase class I-like protein
VFRSTEIPVEDNYGPALQGGCQTLVYSGNNNSELNVNGHSTDNRFLLEASQSNTRLQQQSIISMDQGKGDQAEYNMAERGGGCKLTSDESTLKKVSEY